MVLVCRWAFTQARELARHVPTPPCHLVYRVVDGPDGGGDPTYIIRVSGNLGLDCNVNLNEGMQQFGRRDLVGPFTTLVLLGWSAPCFCGVQEEEDVPYWF